MAQQYRLQSRFMIILLRILLPAVILIQAACSASPTPTVVPTIEPDITPAPGTQKLYADVGFRAVLSQPLPDDGRVYINILDEVTGLALNPQRYEMTRNEDDGAYSINLPFAIGSVAKYRFSREGSASGVEYTPLGDQVRYRMFRVDGPSSVSDTISAWNDQPFNGSTGRITGKIAGNNGGSILPSFLVTAAGIQTLTASDGTFVIEGVPSGTHNLFVYPLDGSYHTFQQGASVQEGMTTPAQIVLDPSVYVNVTFNVNIPVENVVGLPVRLAGSLYQTGNTFADLGGGLSVISSRMPLLNQVEGGHYTLTLALPVGADFQYKYSLGDGFWNSEQTSDGSFALRQLIVPDTDTTIEDSVATWHSGDNGAITFSVQVPASTPESDFLSLQLNPYGWVEPLPMWAMGNNQWLYILYSPLDMIPQLSYRYCRNGLCGSADDMATIGSDSPGKPITLGKDAQTFQDTVDNWAWWQPSNTPTTVIAAEIQPRGGDFTAGIEFQPVYHPSMQLRFVPAYQSIRQVGANWVVIDPTWSISTANPPVMEPIPGFDPLWADLITVLHEANNQGLKSAVFPSPRFESSPEEWWNSSSRDVYWWDAWFDRYEAFILHHADAATQGGASALIIGGDWILPALPDGQLSDGTPSGVPEDAAERWTQIISAARQHFSGTIMWAVSYQDGLDNIPGFIDQLDKIYLLWSAPLTDQTDPQEASLQEQVGTILDADIAPVQELNGKAIILAVEYPSANGSASGCIPDEAGNCVPAANLARPRPDLPGVSLDLQEQVDIYNAIFSAVNQRSWINGIVSRGYYYPAALQDKSASVNGKPAQDVLWYWYPGMATP